MSERPFHKKTIVKSLVSSLTEAKPAEGEAERKTTFMMFAGNSLKINLL